MNVVKYKCRLLTPIKLNKLWDTPTSSGMGRVVMYVRSFQLSDYAAVSKLMADVLSETCCRETLEACARQLSLDSDLVLVAEQRGRVVGVIIGTVDNHNGYYYRVAVAREYQRRGIGKQLITAMSTRFQTRKVRKIMVAADQHNEPLLPLYEALGFTPCVKSAERLRIVSG